MKSIVCIVFGALMIVAQTASAECTSLNQNLKWGMKGEQVRVLQQILNKDPKTQVALSDVGSPGKEGIYFGKATFAAVKKYQELHTAELLTPQQLTKGTGFVGIATRALLNKDACGTGKGSTSKETEFVEQVKVSEDKINAVKDSIAAFILRMKEEKAFPPVEVASTTTATTTTEIVPHIETISPSTGNIGTFVTLQGKNFAKTNDILTTTWRYNGVVSPDGKTLTFTLNANKEILAPDGKLIPELPFTVVVLADGKFSNVVNLKLQ